jgi:hypothetical protein
MKAGGISALKPDQIIELHNLRIWLNDTGDCGNETVRYDLDMESSFSGRC